MVVLKGYCTKCKNKDLSENEHIFNINSTGDICYCPHCMAKYKVEDAKENYRKFIDKKMNKANKAFYRTRDYATSYVLYGGIIEIEPTNIDAHLGRMLSLLLLSGVRRSRFKEVSELLTNEVDLFVKNKRTDAILKFSKHILLNVDTYMDRLYKRLTTNTRFYDCDCLSLYFENIRDALILLNNLFSILKKIESKNAPVDSTITKKLETTIEKLKNKLTDRYPTVEGDIYELMEFHNQEKAIIAKVSKCRSKFVIKSALATLDVNDKKKIPIKEQIFKCYKNRIILGRVLFGGSLLFFAGSIFCILAALVFVIVEAFTGTNIFEIFMFSALGSFVIAAAMMVVSLLIHFKVKKHYKKYINL